jgi:hypothetical protein
MRSSFNLRLLAIFFLLVLIVRCQQRPVEELSSERPVNSNGSEGEVKPKKRVRFAVPESTNGQDSMESNKIAKQQENTQPNEAPNEAPQLEKENINSFYDTTANNNQEELPPPPIDELLTPPVPPMNLPKESKNQLLEEESTNHEESIKELEEIPIITKEEQTTHTTDNKQEKETPPEVSTPPPFPYIENEIPEPLTTKNNPTTIAESEGEPKKDFPTIAQLNVDLGIDISHISIARLEEKGIPTLKNELEKIQQAYEAVKQAFTAKDLTEDAKSRLNEEAFRLNKPRKLYYDFVKAKIKKQKEDLLEDIHRKLEAKQDELIKIKQDMENGESTTMEELSKKISDTQAELEQLNSQKPKISQFKGDLIAFNKAKQESETQIDKKGAALKVLQKQQDSITQQLNIQILKFEELEREIASLLKEEPKKIEDIFNKQIQVFEDIFNKQASPKNKDLVGSMFGNMATKISQLQHQERKEEKMRSDEEWD